MADMGTGNFLTQPNHDVKILQMQCSIQERRSRIVRLNQDIEDLKEMAIKAKEAEVKMLQADLAELTKRLTMITPEDVITINA